MKRALCLERFGFDATVDYKAADFRDRLADACSGGVDVYYDNTDGPITGAVMEYLNIGVRIVVCGTASVANWSPPPQGPRVERHMLVKRARMQGFVIFDHPEYYAQARADLDEWMRGDRLTYVEDVLHGIETAPGAIGVCTGGEPGQASDLSLLNLGTN